ncbi:MAG: hypothetical protein LUC95_01160 [Lachnospiraceae bacterium]|nr:hypothetical protein [Lachnospiraceae bacterium]
MIVLCRNLQFDRPFGRRYFITRDAEGEPLTLLPPDRCRKPQKEDIPGAGA